MPSLRLPPLLPNACQWCQRYTPLAAQASKIPNRSNDDYHATLKALNSRTRRIPRKSLGQHYMLNSSINEQLSSIADLREGDVVLEIGPGTGSLTNVLINAGVTVIAVEKDPHMAMIVKDRFGCTDQLKVLQEDITSCNIHSHVIPLLQEKITKGLPKHAKVVSNIPFNISTDVVKQLLPMGDLFSDVILLLQNTAMMSLLLTMSWTLMRIFKRPSLSLILCSSMRPESKQQRPTEVAHEETALRLADFHLCSSEYRPINLFVNFYSDAEYKFKVERTNFFPQPNVDAAVVKFKLKQNSEYPQVSSRKGFFSMVNSAFNGKRKMLRKSLKHICSAAGIEAALRTAGLQVTARPQELTLEDFVKLYNLISYAE